jgi:hypothetical protein
MEKHSHAPLTPLSQEQPDDLYRDHVQLRPVVETE